MRTLVSPTWFNRVGLMLPAVGVDYLAVAGRSRAVVLAVAHRVARRRI